MGSQKLGSRNIALITLKVESMIGLEPLRSGVEWLEEGGVLLYSGFSTKIASENKRKTKKEGDFR